VKIRLDRSSRVGAARHSSASCQFAKTSLNFVIDEDLPDELEEADKFRP